MGANHACMVRYRYEAVDGSIQMDDFPGIAHLYMSANHQEDGQPPACVHLVLIEWLKYDNRIDHTRGSCHVIKNYKSRELQQFADPGMSGDLDLVALQQVIAPAMIVTEKRPVCHVNGFPIARQPNRASLVVFEPF